MAALTGNETLAPASAGVVGLRGGATAYIAPAVGFIQLRGGDTTHVLPSVGRVSLSGNGVVSEAIKGGAGMKTIMPTAESVTSYPQAP